MNTQYTKTDGVFAFVYLFCESGVPDLVHIRLPSSALLYLNRDRHAQYRALHGQAWNVCCISRSNNMRSRACCNIIMLSSLGKYHTLIKRTPSRRRLTTCSHLSICFVKAVCQISFTSDCHPALCCT